MSLDVLAIAAHPDDVEQTCGGTMIRMAAQGYRTGVLDLTAGDMGTRGTPEQRVEESERAGHLMDLQWRGNLHFPDARLETAEFYKVSKLKVGPPEAVDETTPPPWRGVPPPLEIYRERGHRTCRANLPRPHPRTRRCLPRARRLPWLP